MTARFLFTKFAVPIKLKRTQPVTYKRLVSLGLEAIEEGNEKKEKRGGTTRAQYIDEVKIKK